MTRSYYQILEIDTNATSGEIKNAYYKLAQKWHPDKWMNKSSKERETANEKMKKINEAFEILGDKDLRKRYDNGETITSNFDGYDYEEEIKAEKLRNEEELLRKELEEIDIQLEILKLEMKALDRSSTLNEIGAAFCFTFPRVNEEDLNPSLWQPYQRWGEKVVKMEITIPRGKDRSEELKNFKEQMVKAIKEAEVKLKIKEENKKKSEHDFELNQARTAAFGYIEKGMNEKGLKDQDLGEYANYQEKINSLGEVQEIRDFRDKVLDFIWKFVRKESRVGRENNYHSLNSPYPPERQPNYFSDNNNPNFFSDNSRPREYSNYLPWSNPNPRFPDRSDDFLKTEPRRVLDRWDEPRGRIEEDRMDNFFGGIRDSKYDNWTRQELVDEIKKEQLNNASLHKLISTLETRNKELEENVQALTLKTTAPQTSLFRQMIFGKEKKVESNIEMPLKK